MTCSKFALNPGVTECGAWPYRNFFYDRYPPVNCPDDFYRPEMCDFLSEGFGCGMMPPDFPARFPPPPTGSTGDLTTQPQYHPRFFPHQARPMPIGRQMPGNGRDPQGNVRGPQAQLPQSALANYYRTWMFYRSFKPGMCVPPEIALWGMRRGMLADGPTTTRPPPLDDPAVDAADQELDQSLDELDAATQAGDQQAAEAAQANVRAARNQLNKALVNGGHTPDEYRAAKEQEAQQAGTQQPGGGGEPTPQPQAKSTHPAWWLAAAAAVGAAAWAGYKYGSR